MQNGNFDVADEATGPDEDIVDWALYQAVRAELGANFVRILGYFREDGERAVAKIEAAMHARDTVALVLPAHTLKSEAHQFGAIPVALLAEEIEMAARRGIEGHFFPDDIIVQAAQLRPLYSRTIEQLEANANPLQTRRRA